jgi:GR25 family glycosyltransferase involved in LPS biosynthesis
MNYFKKIYCINLEHRKDRLEQSMEQFESLGVLDRVQFVKAITYDNSKLDPRQNSLMGCLLSHYRVLKDAEENGYENILVFEDDFKFTKDKEYVDQKIDKCTKELPLDWDMLYLGAYFVNGYDYPCIEDYSENLKKVNTAFCAHSLAYSGAGINKILSLLDIKGYDDVERFSKEEESYDWFLVRHFQYENSCFAADELLCEQSAGFSDIEKKFLDYHSKFLLSYKENIKTI